MPCFWLFLLAHFAQSCQQNHRLLSCLPSVQGYNHQLDYTYPCLYPTQPWENISWTETQSCDHQSEWVFRSDVHMTQLNLVWLDHFSGRTDDPDTFSQSDGWLILKKCPSWFSQNAHLWLEIMDAALMRSILTPASSYGCSIVVRLRIFLHL